MLTVRSHLVLLVVAVLLPFAVFAALTVAFHARTERTAIEHGAIETVRAMTSAVDREIASSIAILQALATSRNLDRGDLWAFSDDARRTLATQAAWDNVVLALPSGQQVVNLGWPAGRPLPPTAERRSFDEVLRTGRPVVGDLAPGPLAQRMLIPIRVPVAPGGTLRYVLSAVVNPTAFAPILGRQKVPDDWVMGLLDRNRITVARTKAPEQSVGRAAAPDLVALLDRARTSEGWSRAGRTLEGRPVYAGFSRSEWSGWTVAVGIPADTVEGPVRRSIGTLAAGAVGALLAGLGMAAILGRRISRPIRQLVESTVAWSARESALPSLPSSVTELRQLAHSFQDAAARLREEEKARLALLAREQAARAEAEAARGDAERAAALARGLQAIADVAIAHLKLDELLRHLLRRLRAALAADTASVFLVTPDGGAVALRASDGLEDEGDADLTIPLGEGIVGTVAASGRTRVVPDVAAVPVVSAILRARVRSLVATPLRVDGRVIGVIHVGTVGRRTFAPEEVRLLELVADRAALAIDHARLFATEQAARAEADAANRLKDEFLATLSHELRTPLNAILGWAQVGRMRGRDGETVQRALETIERNAKHQAKLVEDLLDLSRIVTGRLRLDVRRVDLVAVVTAALETARPATSAKQIALAAELEPGVGAVAGDPDRLQQVFWNLFSNAVKFTPRGGRITVRLERSDAQGLVSVTDTGEGIAPEVLPYVFDRFRQGDSSPTRTHGGLGLGLSIVRQLVELHGGTVEARSAGLGQGATFTVRLPLTPVRDPGAERPAGRPSERPRCDGLRVLVVEDEADARQMVAAFLEEYGATATPVASAREALSALAGAPFDVMVSDLAMPEEDGYALIRRIRALPPDRGGRIPAIALTAHATSEARLRALVDGFDTYLAKPVEPVELAALVARAVTRRG